MGHLFSCRVAIAWDSSIYLGCLCSEKSLTFMSISAQIRFFFAAVDVSIEMCRLAQRVLPSHRAAYEADIGD